MQRIIVLWILLAIVPNVLSYSSVCSQDSTEKNWSDLLDEEKEAIRMNFLESTIVMIYHLETSLIIQNWSDGRL